MITKNISQEFEREGEKVPSCKFLENVISLYNFLKICFYKYVKIYVRENLWNILRIRMKETCNLSIHVTVCFAKLHALLMKTSYETVYI